VGSENPLEQYFRANQGRLIHKWVHYFDIYHRHFERFRGRPVVIVEFGVSQGGSLEMWRDYFGDAATIYGVDIDERCADLGGPGTHILIGDQEDRDFLRSVGERTGPIDILIEDGGHKMAQQIATFEELYPSSGMTASSSSRTCTPATGRSTAAATGSRARSCAAPSSSPTSSTLGTPGTTVSRWTTSPRRPGRCTSTTASWSSRRAASSSRTTR